MLKLAILYNKDTAEELKKKYSEKKMFGKDEANASTQFQIQTYFPLIC